MTSRDSALSTTSKPEPAGRAALPGQVVLVMQGGGAQGAYQGGVYQALHEAGIEPDWVIGTSVGAINGSIIAGNEVARRLERLREFWSRIESRPLCGFFDDDQDRTKPTLPVAKSRSRYVDLFL
jgi:predicted acylesterase/phospholipase RssA